MNLEEIKTIVASMEADESKFDNGTNSAGSRLRKGLQALIVASKQYRVEILDKQKAAKAEKKK